MYDAPFILASGSPRRKVLLEKAGFRFQVQQPGIRETAPPKLKPEKVPAHLAARKARTIQLQQDTSKLVLGADTVVILDNELIGKPDNFASACRMLRALSGKKHYVITGVCLLQEEKEVIFSVTTAVWFRTLSREEIQAYVKTYEPYDKAGSYAIQEKIGVIGVERLEGCYYNVVGLPVSRIISAMHKF